ncbi:MAG: hypothetical protein KY442_00825, partial [Proteobacteria bacterium]|nr:hypothetical protein [Pseudomonadota bacterium]
MNSTDKALTLFQLGRPSEQRQIPFGASTVVTPVGLSVRGNLALVPLVAQLWCHAVVELFRENTVAAWRAVPLDGDDQPGSEVLAKLQASILDIARGSVADLAEVELEGSPRWIGDLA